MSIEEPAFVPSLFPAGDTATRLWKKAVERHTKRLVEKA